MNNHSMQTCTPHRYQILIGSRKLTVPSGLFRDVKGYFGTIYWRVPTFMVNNNPICRSLYIANSFVVICDYYFKVVYYNWSFGFWSTFPIPRFHLWLRILRILTFRLLCRDLIEDLPVLISAPTKTKLLLHSTGSVLSSSASLESPSWDSPFESSRTTPWKRRIKIR